MDIDIDKYISEEEKKEIVISEYKEMIRNGLLISKDTKKNTDNYERVLYNAIYNYLGQEIDNIIGVDSKKLIEEKTIQLLKKPSSYSVFRYRSAWESENSIATDYMNKCIKDNFNIIEKTVKQKLTELPDSYFESVVEDLVYNVIRDRITGNKNTK